MNKHNVVCFGEILWDSFNGKKRIGGAPLNVCYHLNKLGIRSYLITQVGDDTNGMEILDKLDSLGISKKFCNISLDKPTSTVEVILGDDNQVNYEILTDVAWDSIPYTNRIDALTEEDYILVYGSLAARSEVTRSTLLRLLGKSGLNVFDVNLRAPHYEKETILKLLGYANILKLNQEELLEIISWIGNQQDSIIEKLKFLQKKFPNLKEILLTRGEQGSTYFSEDSLLENSPIKVAVQDTVGSGDSFLAAFLANKIGGAPLEVNLKEAGILSAYVATRTGACPDYDSRDIDLFKKQHELK